ncbi:MAG: hypothetical protein HYS18_11200 [Burkholderiales bacterium]|nr:hypothetical protein [Burkholderiales bacterium]
MKRIGLLLAITFFSASYAGSLFDYSTPEKALASLENAYKNKDIEAAVRSKAFNNEAKNMLLSRFKPEIIDEALVKKTSEVLELSFRKQIAENGFPDFSDIKCTATSKREGQEIAVVTEVCRYPDGGSSIQYLRAYRRNNLWKIGELIK